MRNIVLFGFMGTGKTSVGRKLASSLGMKFIDMDQIIEEREKRSIKDIFAADGEPYFRKLERALVEELAQRRGLVIGTGGGVVLNADNVRDFAATGLCVCLSAAPEVILKRLEKDGSRPLLAEGDKLQKIKGILESRRQLYAKVPVQVDTTGLSVDEVVQRITAIVSQGQEQEDL
jgi:shikimate kinase